MIRLVRSKYNRRHGYPGQLDVSSHWLSFYLLLRSHWVSTWSTSAGLIIAMLIDFFLVVQSSGSPYICSINFLRLLWIWADVVVSGLEDQAKCCIRPEKRCEFSHLYIKKLCFPTLLLWRLNVVPIAKWLSDKRRRLDQAYRPRFRQILLKADLSRMIAFNFQRRNASNEAWLECIEWPRFARKSCLNSVLCRVLHSPSGSRNNTLSKQSKMDLTEPPITFQIRVGNRTGIEQHIFKLETCRDLSSWVKAIIQGTFRAVEVTQEMSWGNCTAYQS